MKKSNKLLILAGLVAVMALAVVACSGGSLSIGKGDSVADKAAWTKVWSDTVTEIGKNDFNGTFKQKSSMTAKSGGNETSIRNDIIYEFDGSKIKAGDVYYERGEGLLGSFMYTKYEKDKDGKYQKSTTAYCQADVSLGSIMGYSLYFDAFKFVGGQYVLDIDLYKSQYKTQEKEDADIGEKDKLKVKIVIKDGKISGYSVDGKSVVANATVKDSATITYGGATVTLPTVG